MLNVRKHKLKIINLILIFAYAVLVCVTLIFEINERRNEITRCVDNRLYSAASVVKYLLADDFHDRAVEPGAIGMNEERMNRNRVNNFNRQNEFEWVYTAVEWGGNYFFTAPTVSEIEAMQRKSWYFYPFEEIPREFKDALDTGKPAALTYRDSWGVHRAVAVPQSSPLGNPYISCVEYNISAVDSEIRQGVIISAVRFAVIGLIVFPFLCLNIISNIRMDRMNTELDEYRRSLEHLVSERTRELRDARDKLQEQAIRDSLTGIYNRRFMTDRIQEEMSRYQRSHSAFTIMVLDLDNFKGINDRFGHVAGDQVLKNISRLIGEHLRPHDVFGRFGGDEFIILLPDTALDNAKAVGEKLLSVVRGADNTFIGQIVSVSIGAAEYIPDEDFQDFLTRADLKMYEAKKFRNSICS